MLDTKLPHCPTIVYRPILPTDLEVLEQIHAALFPMRYELEFFLNVVNGRGIVSWAAVDISRHGNQSDKLVGFVTTRLVSAKESEISDLLRYESSRMDTTLIYILTLGVVEAYRNLGIATYLVQEVIKYASSLPSCRAVYLHVIDYNDPAIHFYRKMLFKLVRRLPHFYYIRGRHYDSYLFVYYVNGGSPCSPIGMMAAVAAYLKGLYRLHWRQSCGRMRRRNLKDGRRAKSLIPRSVDKVAGFCAPTVRSVSVFLHTVVLSNFPKGHDHSCCSIYHVNFFALLM